MGEAEEKSWLSSIGEAPQLAGGPVVRFRLFGDRLNTENRRGQRKFIRERLGGRRSMTQSCPFCAFSLFVTTTDDLSAALARARRQHTNAPRMHKSQHRTEAPVPDLNFMALELLFVKTPSSALSNNLRSLQIRNYQASSRAARYSIEAGRSREATAVFCWKTFRTTCYHFYWTSSCQHELSSYCVLVSAATACARPLILCSSPFRAIESVNTRRHNFVIVVFTMIQLTVDFLALGTQSFSWIILCLRFGHFR